MTHHTIFISLNWFTSAYFPSYKTTRINVIKYYLILPGYHETLDSLSNWGLVWQFHAVVYWLVFEVNITSMYLNIV